MNPRKHGGSRFVAQTFVCATHACGINEEFRRRTKTQASLLSEEAVLLLLFGLLRSGQVTLRRLVGWQDLNNITSGSEAA
jgi:hypothetical protein